MSTDNSCSLACLSDLLWMNPACSRKMFLDGIWYCSLTPVPERLKIMQIILCCLSLNSVFSICIWTTLQKLLSSLFLLCCNSNLLHFSFLKILILCILEEAMAAERNEISLFEREGHLSGNLDFSSVNGAAYWILSGSCVPGLRWLHLQMPTLKGSLY